MIQLKLEEAVAAGYEVVEMEGEPCTDIFCQGGYLFMVPLLIMLLLVVFLFIRGIKANTEKNSRLLKSVGLFSLVFGVLGFIIGMLGALEAISIADSISQQVLTGGLRIALIAPTFGLIILVIARLFDIVLLWMRGEK
ncbi:MotA/TolQ/ExbB proton channel family protein [Tenacibaculum sp. MAR_2009_124]|uniref:MotA/TolQ/ExbB proton channel family protein n=1 Tax=Tenacibaculum sp. MAR_2009_124 TaxID=1250059 RepID=UPI00089A514C|nr:MotA/TolQ/ExbB proton channel family protein [Tenacibaculum sp. MAR_2009_124]SEB67930.1 MotA/TolQ/ExbB proton channel family protein [Tenacibaculum sp. MAR_2009_124]